MENEEVLEEAAKEDGQRISMAREVRETNIELVRKLQIRGVTKVNEIQAYFRRQEPPIIVKNRTVERYKSIVKKRNARRLVSSEKLWKTVEELALELRDNYREVLKELWVIVHRREASPRDKIAAMTQITNISENWIKRLQSLGLVHEEPEKHQMVGADGNPIDPPPAQVNIENLNTEFIAFIKAKFQNPVGSTGDYKNLERGKSVDVQPNEQPAQAS